MVSSMEIMIDAYCPIDGVPLIENQEVQTENWYSCPNCQSNFGDISPESLNSRYNEMTHYFSKKQNTAYDPFLIKIHSPGLEFELFTASVPAHAVAS